MEQKTRVVIVGAGPAGLATAACLNVKKIPNIVLEREDCAASLWRRRAYDRLKLHLAKEFCHLPHMPFPADAPTFVPRAGFIRYLDAYAAELGVEPRYCRSVVSAAYDEGRREWALVAREEDSGATERYTCEFLVVATGENSEGYIPHVPGLDTFGGDVMHSSRYENGDGFEGTDVLVVGSGNSGMEIALDLANWGARASVVVRSPVHVLSENMVRLGMNLLSYLPLNLVDNLVVFLGEMKHGNLSKFGIRRPNEGPFFLKMATGRSAVIDVGTVAKIKSGEIQVFPSIQNVDGNHVNFSDGRRESFDTIIFATGYKSTVRRWLQDDGGLFGEDGMPKEKPPSHWKGENGIYCAGFARSGLAGIAQDAKNIANDINAIFSQPN